MKRQFGILLILGIFVVSCTSPLKEDQYLISNLMKREPWKFQHILDNKDRFEVQIMYTQVNRDSINRPIFRSFYFNVDSGYYFYPASTVKLPMVLLALEKINQLKIRGLDKYTPMFSDSVYEGQYSARMDTTAADSFPSIAHYARKILVTSDNDAFNRLYEWMGQKAANEILREKNYNIRVLHRLERPLSPDQNRHTEAIRFIRNDTLVFQQDMLINPDSIRPLKRVLKGLGYYKDDTLVQDPFEFTYKNYYPIAEQQEILKAILFPEFTDAKRRFHFTEEDRKFVLQYMSQLPGETAYPPYYKDTTFYDAYCKFLMFGNDKTPIPRQIRIFNKVGDAYGYLIDNAYIVDFDNGVEFILSAVINTNLDGIYNDGLYEYNTLGYPFMKDLGKLIYSYELKRKRKFKPDLSAFRFSYDR